MDWKGILNLAAPFALSMSGVPVALVPLVMHGISVAEDLGGTGAEKKAKALDLVQTGAAAVNAATGKTYTDPALVTDTVSKGIDVAVQTTNIIHQAQSVAKPKTIPVPPPNPVPAA